MNRFLSRLVLVVLAVALSVGIASANTVGETSDVLVMATTSDATATTSYAPYALALQAQQQVGGPDLGLVHTMMLLIIIIIIIICCIIIIIVIIVYRGQRGPPGGGG